MPRSICCFRGDDDDEAPYVPIADERSSLVHNPPGSRFKTVNDFLNHNKNDDEMNLWTNPDDKEHTQEEDDRELHRLLEERQISEVQDKRKFDEAISRIQDERKTLQNRWRKVLKSQGFDKDSTPMLEVHSIALSDPSKLGRYRELLHRLHVETSIFSGGPVQAKRYLVVLERLEDVDAAEDFIQTASIMYPKPD